MSVISNFFRSRVAIHLRSRSTRAVADGGDTWATAGYLPLPMGMPFSFSHNRPGRTPPLKRPAVWFIKYRWLCHHLPWQWCKRVQHEIHQDFIDLPGVDTSEIASEHKILNFKFDWTCPRESDLPSTFSSTGRSPRTVRWECRRRNEFQPGNVDDSARTCA